jgi:hypothetical protein
MVGTLTTPPVGRLGATSIDCPDTVELAEVYDVAVARAVALGARQAEHQADPSRWRVLFDPAGHPFCLTTVGAD